MSNHLPLNTHNLIIGYKGKKQEPIAGPLDFNIQKGKLYGLIGVNGIGKSTLIKTISGLLPPLEGQVLINGQDIFKLNAQERATYISLVLTDRFNSGLATVLDIIKMGRYPYTNWQFALSTNDTEIINSAINAVGLEDKRNSLFEELSDGNKQKVMIAKALAQDTPLLILDEPTVHLDIKNRYIILEMLQILAHKHQKTIIFSGHDLDYMLTFCDQLMLMTPHKLVIDSPSQFIKTDAISIAFDMDASKIQGLHIIDK